jgi:hypothetical protein
VGLLKDFLIFGLARAAAHVAGAGVSPHPPFIARL